MFCMLSWLVRLQHEPVIEVLQSLLQGTRRTEVIA
jgi:hypothetical protein